MTTSKKIPLSVQLWSVRDDVTSDMAGTLAKIGKMGFDGVEFAGYGQHKAGDIARYLADAGLRASGCHIALDAFNDAVFNQTVDFHKAAGISWLILPWLDPKLRDTPDACKATAEKLATLVTKLSAVGLKTGFHLHDADIKPLADGKSAWQHLAAHTPREFIMQFDTGNAKQGGADPVAGLKELSGRALSLHLKEFPMDGSPIGGGQIPWHDIFNCAQSVGTQWYVAECEVYTKHKPMELIELSARWLREQGI